LKSRVRHDTQAAAQAGPGLPAGRLLGQAQLDVSVTLVNDRSMSALIDPDDDPMERCSVLCSEVLFELKRDLFVVEDTDVHDQDKDTPFKTTVIPQSCPQFTHFLV
jgi:hypothetical protein